MRGGGRGGDKPHFLITIDTEGDNLWARPRVITTKNAAFLPRFQALCESYALKATYLTNYEMAVCPVFIDFARDVLARGTGEIGMHLHAWNSPPLKAIGADDFLSQPYLMEYPVSVMKNKISYLTSLLEDTFGVKMVSHRAGRWAFNADYAGLLLEQGYRVDCSVTPHVAWRPAQGGDRNATDYTGCPEWPYYVDMVDVRRPGSSTLLEVPVSIRKRQSRLTDHVRSAAGLNSLLKRSFERVSPSVVWLRPNGRNRKHLEWVLRRAEEGPVAEFILHSSELMPGGSPTFRRPRDIERLYEDLHWLFERASSSFRAGTLRDFGEAFGGDGPVARSAFAERDRFRPDSGRSTDGIRARVNGAAGCHRSLARGSPPRVSAFGRSRPER